MDEKSLEETIVGGQTLLFRVGRRADEECKIGDGSDMRKLYQPSCEQCKRMAHHKTGEEGAPRFFCIGKRTAGKAVCEIDQYNFCVYTPFKGVIQFQVWEGDMEIWIALFWTARTLIAEDKKLPSIYKIHEGWLECMYNVFTKEANRPEERYSMRSNE